MAGFSNAPEMYTASIGLYAIWITIKLIFTFHKNLSLNTISFYKVTASILFISKCIIVGVILFIIIPLLMGHFVELILLSILKVSLNRCSLFFISTVSSQKYKYNKYTFMVMLGMGFRSSSHKMFMWNHLAD